jgi:hypothetical protein
MRGRRQNSGALAPKALQTYYNILDPKEIQQRADTEIALEKVYGDWPVGTDPAVQQRETPLLHPRSRLARVVQLV